MTNPASEASDQIDGQPFWKRHPILIGLALFLFLNSQMPLFGYLEGVVLNMFEIGIINAIEKQNDWFVRYFTGPPSDAEMIANFNKHRAKFERLVHLQLYHGYCHHQEQLHPGSECARLEKDVGMRASLSSQLHFSNSALQHPSITICGTPCYAQEFDYSHKQLQQWFGTKNPKIETWEKFLLYVPPLVPAERFGLDPKGYPPDSLSAISKKCHIKDTLDSIPPELEADPGDHAYPNCAVRHIDGQWFLMLEPHNVLDF